MEWRSLPIHATNRSYSLRLITGAHKILRFRSSWRLNSKRWRLTFVHPESWTGFMPTFLLQDFWKICASLSYHQQWNLSSWDVIMTRTRTGWPRNQGSISSRHQKFLSAGSHRAKKLREGKPYGSSCGDWRWLLTVSVAVQQQLRRLTMTGNRICCSIAAVLETDADW